MFGFDQPWWRRYRRFLVWSDTVVVLWAASVVPVAARLTSGPVAGLRPWTQVVLSLSAALTWWLALAVFRSRDHRVLGVGQEEYRRIVAATADIAGAGAILAYLVRDEFLRAYLVLSIPIGAATLLVTRWLWRQWLHVLRRDGGWSSRVLVVGSDPRAAELATHLNGRPWAGYEVIGTWALPEPRPGSDGERARDILRMARRQSASVIAVAACDAIGPPVLRRLGWLMEGTGMQLVVAPGLTTVAGPRVHTRPLTGLPLLCIEEPSFTGAGRVAKRAFDLLCALAVTVVLAPLLVVVAVLIRLDSPGPVFHRQRRIGRHGKEFRIWKLRTMILDAEERRRDLAAHNESDGPLFKIRDDPRVTRLGRVLRRYSIDELPQVVNVLAGQMSLVGPRPPLPDEVRCYGKDTRRRLLVKPGITGLWQISGRADLRWRDGLELDLYYVENWSFTTDLVILWKTARVVVRGMGAY